MVQLACYCGVSLVAGSRILLDNMCTKIATNSRAVSSGSRPSQRKSGGKRSGTSIKKLSQEINLICVLRRMDGST